MKQFLICFSFFIFGKLIAQIPNQNYPDNEAWKVISPQMGKEHINQPSVISGHVVLAGNGIHQIWNISNPYQPSLVKEFRSPVHRRGEQESHQVSYMKDNDGNLFLVTTSGKGIDIWDINDIKNPRNVSSMTLPGIDFGDVTDAVWGNSVQGNIIYVGATNHGLYVVDAKDKANPKLVKTLTEAQIGGFKAGPVFNIGNLLVVTTPKNTSGIATFDISNSENPILLDSFKPTYKPWRSYIGGFYGKYATLINPFQIYDVTTDPMNITNVSTTTIPKSEYTTYDDDFLYLGGSRGGTEGIWKFDISDPTDPVQVGRVVGRDTRWDDQFSVPVGNLLIVADDQYVNGFVGAVVAVHDTKKDTKPPRVIYTNPENGATKQALTSKIGISLSSWINFNKVDKKSFRVRKVGGADVSGSFGWTYTVLSFEPSQPLDPNATYEVILDGDEIQDLVGNKLGNNYTFRFSTGNAVITSEDITIESPQAVDVGQPVNWKVVNPNSNYTYQWNTGNGNEVTGTSPVFRYNQSGRYNVILSAFEQTSNISIEAELGTNHGGVINGNSNGSFSGSGYVDFPSETGDDVYVELQFENSQATSNGTLSIRYAMGAGGSRPLNLSINGGAPKRVEFPSTGGWDVYENETLRNINLPKGTITLRLSATAGSQGGNIDRFDITNNNTQPRLVNTLAFNQVVNGVSTAIPSKSSSQFAKIGNKVWVVNEDANTVSSITVNGLQKSNEITVGEKPIAIANVGNNKLWVLNKNSATISVVNTNTNSIERTIRLPRASKPSALVVNQDLTKGYVSLQSLGKILELTVSSNSVSKEIQLNTDTNGILPKPGAMATDGEFLYVVRFVSENAKSEIFKIATNTFNNYSTITLGESTGTDGSRFGRGIPNYLTKITIAPDGNSLRIASKKDNIKRGIKRDGLPLQHDNTVRAMVAKVNLNTDTDDLDGRMDLDNSDRCHSVVFSDNGNVAFISKPGNNEVFVADANTNVEIARLVTEEVPTDLFYDDAQKRLYVNNFLGRSVSVFDVSTIVNGGSTSSILATVGTVSNELLTAEVLKGKKLFYDSSSPRLIQEGYMACASCHLDGGGDGQVYDFTNLGEGFRNTISLIGKAGMEHGRLHWTANFDEIHDFENQIRALNGGTGLMTNQDFNAAKDPLGENKKAGKSQDLDALAAYITSLNTFEESPYTQSNGNLTQQAQNGRQLFNNLKCYECHSGATYTKSSSANNLFDIGTIANNSGKRIDKKLLGIDVPTLLGLWDTAPYLHDGSAATLMDVLTTRNTEGKHADVSGLNQNQLNDLIAYLKQLDGSAPAASDSTLSLAVSSPAYGQKFDEGANVTIDISSSIGTISNVEYYINNDLAANITSAPFSYEMTNATSGIKEVIVKAFYNNGTAIVSECHEFEITQPSIIADGIYFMKKASANSYLKAVSAQDNITNVADNTSEDTKWKITGLGNNEYEIRSVAYPESRLEVPFGEKGKGVEIATTSWTGQANHIVWTAERVGDNFIFIPKHDATVALDMYESNTVVHTWDKNSNNANQIISLVPTDDNHQIVVNARGVTGTESITLSVAGQAVQTWTLSTTAQNYTATTSLTGNVRVEFTNDNNGNRDVFLDYISVNDQRIQSEDRSVNTAVYQNGSCGGSNSETMHCNGYIDFGDISPGRRADIEQLIDQEITVYPNPASNILYIKGIPNTANTQVRLSVIDILGKQVFFDILDFTSRKDTRQLDVSSFDKGMYYMIVTIDNQKRVINFIKE